MEPTTIVVIGISVVFKSLILALHRRLQERQQELLRELREGQSSQSEQLRLYEVEKHESYEFQRSTDLHAVHRETIETISVLLKNSQFSYDMIEQRVAEIRWRRDLTRALLNRVRHPDRMQELEAEIALLNDYLRALQSIERSAEAKTDELWSNLHRLMNQARELEIKIRDNFSDRIPLTAIGSG